MTVNPPDGYWPLNAPEPNAGRRSVPTSLTFSPFCACGLARYLHAPADASDLLLACVRCDLIPRPADPSA